tara:strand:- start:632 stop:880 length:249 start_codon:yes stop_codon:yes gene_type:complete
MKKLIIPVVLLLSSCKLQQDKVYYSNRVKKCIHNLEQLENFIQQDYLEGQIPLYAANNYLTVVRYTKCSLLKDSVKKDDCFD